MKSVTLFLGIMLMFLSGTFAQTNTGETIKRLSKEKWQWMSNKDVDKLSRLFDAKCDFVHKGGTWGTPRELEIIKSGFIWYKQAEVYSTSVKMFGNTAIVLNDIDLVAQVGANVVTNPFMVTEVYVFENNEWKMIQLTFSQLMREVKLKP